VVLHLLELLEDLLQVLRGDPDALVRGGDLT
jgi:hypothetical protein